MNRLLSVLGALILVLMCAPRAWAANISVTINQPTAGAVALNSLSVTATATSLYQLKSIHADVETAGMDLTAGGGTWSGTLSLSSLGRGTKTLTVTATDLMNQTATAQVSFAKDAPPSIVILDPVDATVGRPELHIAGTCIDDDPAGCAKFQAFVGSTLVASGTSSVDVTVSLDSFITEGNYTTISFQATDSLGQFTLRNIGAFLNTNPKLVAIESFPGGVYAFDDARALYCTPDCINGVELYDRTTKQSTLLNPPPFRGRTNAWLSATGVVVEQDGGAGNDEIYDYKSGQFTDLGPAGNFGVYVAGAYAVWLDSAKNVVLADLTTDTTKVVGVSSTTNSGTFDVAATGDVAFVSVVGSSDEVFRYHNGVATRISPTDMDGHIDFVRLNEVNVVYRKGASTSTNESIWFTLVGPSGATQIASPQTAADPGDFQLNAGYVLFPRVAGGVYQVILRDPSGQETQLSIFGTSSAPISVSPTGEAIWANGNTYYRGSASNPQAEAVNRGPQGVFVWTSKGWEVILGNTIFCLTDGSGSPCPAGSTTTGAGGAAASTGSGSTASAGGTSASGGGTNAGTGGSASSSTNSGSSGSAVGVGGSSGSLASGGGGASISSSVSSTSGTSVGTGTGGSGGVGGGTGSSVNSTVGTSSTAGAGGIGAGSGGMPPSGSSSDSGGGCTASGSTQPASGFAGYLLAGLTLSLMHRRRRASGRDQGSRAAA